MRGIYYFCGIFCISSYINFIYKSFIDNEIFSCVILFVVIDEISRLN